MILYAGQYGSSLPDIYGEPFYFRNQELHPVNILDIGKPEWDNFKKKLGSGIS